MTASHMTSHRQQHDSQRVSDLGLTRLEAVVIDEAGEQLIPPPPVVPGSRV